MRFTVLTATYNRAHTLAGVYQSLCAQTFRGFGWVLIDDGSSNPRGAARYYKELAGFKVPVRLRVKAALNAVRFSLVAIARPVGPFK